MKNLFSQTPRWFHSVRTKQAVFAVALMSCVSGFLYWYFPARLENQAIQSVSKRANTIAIMMAYGVGSALVEDDHTLVGDIVLNAKQNPELVYVMVVGQAGDVIASYDPARACQANYSAAGLNEKISEDRITLQTAAPILSHREEVGRVYVGLSLQSVNMEVEKSRTTIAWVSFFVGFGGLILVILFGRILTMPLSRMVNAAERISQGDWKQRVESRSRDEYGNLAVAFNTMVSTLELAYEEVRESENNYRKLFDLIPHPMWVFDRNTLAFLEVNEAAIRHYGFSRNEFLTMTIKDIRPPEEVPRLLEELTQQQGGLDSRGMWKHMKKDGTVIDVEITSQGIRLADKSALIIVATDITARKNAEDHLRESEERYRDLFENSNDLIQSVGPDLRFQFVNNAWLEALGYTQEEVNQLNPFDIIKKEEADHCLALFGEVMRGKRANNVQTTFVSKDGREVTVEGSVNAKFENGVPVSTRGIFRDISDRKRAEESLADEGNLLRTMIDNIPDRIYVKDAQCRFLVNNIAHVRALGAKSRDEVVGKTDFDYRPEELASQYYQDDQEVVSSGLARNREEPSVLPTGEKLWLSTTKVPLRDRTGAVVGIVGISRDITERIKTEDALKHERILLRTLIDNIPDAICVKDLASRKLVANTADVHNMGLESESDVLGKDDYAFFPREVADAFFADDQFVLHTGQPLLNREEYVVDPEGVKHWLLTSKLPLRDGKGQIVGLVGVGRDITERKQAEEALRASEAQLSEALKISRLGYWERDFVKDEFTFNDQFYDLLHTTAEREGGYSMPTAQFVQRFVYPEDVPLVAREGRLAAETTAPDFNRQLDHRIICADGEMRYFTVRHRVVKDACGRTVKTFGVHQDVTERRRAEEYLRRATEEMHSIFWRSIVTKTDDETLGAGGFVWNTEYLNLDAIQKFFPPSMDPAKAYDEFYKSRVEEDRLAMDRRSSDALRRGLEGYTQEFRIHDAGGILHWMSEDARIQRLSETQFEVIGLITDITERKQIEKEILMLAHTVRGINECISITDTEDRIIFVNQAFERTYGYKQEEIIGKPVTIVRAPSCAELPILNATLDGGWHGEVMNRKKDGTEFPALLSTSLIRDESGQTIALVGVASDITEAKQLVAKREKLMKELESTNKELNDFAYIVSHDLKAPLRAIGSLVDWLCADYGEKLGEEGNEMLKVLLGRTKRMHDLIEGVLRYSRIGRTNENKTELELEKLVPEIVEMIDPPKHIGVKIQHPLPIIMGETTRVQQVFQNLLSNAIKFMDKPRGEIQIGCERENGHWKFSVADNGPGIEERHHEKVFQIFQTLSSRDDFESTGIGLTIVKKIVETYDGKIWLESKVGSGTVFYFTLPALLKN